MSERDFEHMDQAQFDAMIAESIYLPPDEDVIDEINPWRRAMCRILWGLGLNAFTLNFFGLNYLLPAIGAMLVYLGFRALRRENRWFHLCWALSGLWVLDHGFLLILNATAWQEAFYAHPAAYVLTAAMTLVQLALLVGLRQGLAAVQQSVGLSVKVRAATALVVWYVVIILLALLASGLGWLVAIPMIIAYIFIIRGMIRLYRGMEESGYALRLAPSRMKEGVLAVTVTAIVAVGVLLGLLLGQRYPMDWQPVRAEEATETTVIREKLHELGAPMDVLRDLTAEELADCADAQRLIVNEGDYWIDREGGRTSWRSDKDHKADVRLTFLGIQTGDDPDRWRIIHHFQWVTDPGFRGTECLTITPAARQGVTYQGDGQLTGRVLYEKDGGTWAAPYYDLGPQVPSQDPMMGMLGWQDNSSRVCARFSLPRKSLGRCYVTYAIEATSDEVCIVDSWGLYTCQFSPWQYPAHTAVERNHWNISEPFATIQTALQFVPFEDRLDDLD